jgi:hypothetical protein
MGRGVFGGRGKLLARSFPLPPSPHPLSRTCKKDVYCIALLIILLNK